MCSLKPFVQQDKILIVSLLLPPFLSLTGTRKSDLFQRTLEKSDIVSLLTLSHISIPLFI